MSGRPVTDEDLARLRHLHAQGMARNAIAREMGRSKVTVSRMAERLGLAFDRAATRSATAAKVADARAKRAHEMEALLEDAKRLRLQLFAPCTIHAFGGKDNTHNSAYIDQPLFADQAKIMQAYGVAIEKSLRLDLHDGDGSVDGVSSLLGNLFASLRADEPEGPVDDG